jgi:hypothetical protein
MSIIIEHDKANNCSEHIVLNTQNNKIIKILNTQNNLTTYWPLSLAIGKKKPFYNPK